MDLREYYPSDPDLPIIKASTDFHFNLMAYPNRGDSYQKYLQADKQIAEKQQILEAMSSGGQYDEKGRLRIPLLGCVGGALVLVLFVTGIFAYTSIVLEQTWFVSGDISHYDPIASYAEAAGRAGTDAVLVKLEASMVNSDGTLDLKADYNPGPTVNFTFYRQVPPPKDAPPPGSTPGNGNTWYETITLDVYKPWTFRGVHSIGSNGDISYQYFNLGMDKDTSPPTVYSPGEAAPIPKCFFKTLWETAQKKGIPSTAVSDISYDSTGYQFSIYLNGKRTELDFDQNCQLIPAP